MAMAGILIDYEYCTGCKACTMACKVEHDLPEGREGVIVNEFGPWAIDEQNDVYQYDIAPFFTDECDLCAERVAKGKLPTCVKHCLAAVLTYGSVEELCAKLAGKPKQILFVPKSGQRG